MKKVLYFAPFIFLPILAIFLLINRQLSQTSVLGGTTTNQIVPGQDTTTPTPTTSPTASPVTLVAVGDISYSRAVARSVTKTNDFLYPFRKIKDEFAGADIVFGNLETPITPGQDIPDFNMTFRSNPEMAKALRITGFTVLSLANNHTMNFGEKGLFDTFNYLNQVGLKYVGAGKNRTEANQPLFIALKGIKFAFLAFNDADVVPPSYEAGTNHAGTALMHSDLIAAAVKDAKSKADFIIVSMHSGTEYQDQPNKSQISFAHTAVEAGADLIIGHHPHVVQPMEKYHGKYIFYSLGNFVFDQPSKFDTRAGLMIKVTFTPAGVEVITQIPVFMENLAQPRLATASESAVILDRLNLKVDQPLIR